MAHGQATADTGTLVRVLGPVSATVCGRSSPLTSRRLRALLALLALEAGRVVPDDRLLSELWGDAPPGAPSASLQVYVSRLRRSLGEAADDDGGSTGVRVRRRAPGYLLELPDGALDAQRLSRLTTAARGRLAAEPAVALDLLEQGLALVAGDPLEDVVDALGPVAQAEARRLGDLVLTAREARVEALLGVGRAADAVADAERLLAAEPLRETLHVLHLLALYRCGRQAEALTAFEAVRRRLADELGVDPGPALRRLHAQLLAQDPALDGPPSPGTVPQQRVAAPASRTAAQLHGRDRELAALEAAAQSVLSGSGAVWLVSGEAGIGKTRLLQEAARAARAAGLTVAVGGAQETADTAPYWTWGGVLRGLPGLPRSREVAVVLGTDEAADAPAPLTRVALHEGVVQVLVEHALAAGPLLLVLEDVHWADEASLALLAALADRVATAPVLVLTSYRTEQAAPGGALGALLARLARSAPERLHLTGLRGEAARELLGDRLGWRPEPDVAEAAADRTAGNPFFLQELARLVRDADDPAQGWQQVPGTVRDVLLHRLTGLPAPSRRLLDVAAVVGRECELGLLEAVSGLTGEQVDAGLASAVLSGLVTEVVAPWPVLRFPHALVREALYDQLGARARMRLHADVGAALAARPDADVDDVASHLLAGGDLADPAAAVSAALSAASRALSQVAHDHAASLLDRAAPVLARLPEGEVRDALELGLSTRRGTLVATREGFAAPAAEAALERAQELALRLAPSGDVLAALYRRYLWLLMSADYPAVRRLADAVLDRAAAVSGADRERFALLGRLARGSVLWCLGDGERAVDELRSALASAESAGVGVAVASFGDPAVRARMFLCHAHALAGHRDEAVAVADEMVLRAHESGPADESDALATRGMMYVAFRDPLPARDDGVEGRRLGRLAGAALLEQFGGMNQGWGEALAHGREAVGAVERVRAATEAYRATGTRMHDPIVFTMLAEAEAATGDRERAARAADEGLRALARTGSRLWADRLTPLASR